MTVLINSLGERIGLLYNDTFLRIQGQLVKDHQACIARLRDARRSNRPYNITVRRCLRYGGSDTIRRVMTTDRLRISYHEFEYRRELLNSYDLFLVDKPAQFLVAKLAGRKFWLKRKVPVPITLLGDNNDHNLTKVEENLNTILNSTYVYNTEGPCLSVRVGDSSHTAEELKQNIRHAVAGTVEKLVARKWKGVTSIVLKTQNGPPIPLYHKTLEPLSPSSSSSSLSSLSSLSSSSHPKKPRSSSAPASLKDSPFPLSSSSSLPSSLLHLPNNELPSSLLHLPLQRLRLKPKTRRREDNDEFEKTRSVVKERKQGKTQNVKKRKTHVEEREVEEADDMRGSDRKNPKTIGKKVIDSIHSASQRLLPSSKKMLHLGSAGKEPAMAY